jgi:hypothetical protein
MAVKLNKKNKASVARKNAEAAKAKKKAIRVSNSSTAVATKSGSKGRSIIGQSKKRK